ncbi:site-2 protease family protein [Oscillatoria sp. FACHB-1407]|uniref:site-2 protease family protein n=1 Tax=Oscillatoria sp. FACHB-1407 TaxID=2692847 RepID=UPI001686ED18|nr:site-2 protease family protein [Oscillatoria sp. FACHB-1407]MBD2461243.1 site-2 protease family protein [Oscillatoria sp. FACHB-1407]
MDGNLRVGNLFGIPFFINPSWFLVLALVTWQLGPLEFPQLGAIAWVLGLATALLLFASVLAHELGHSLVALRQGIPVNSITLFIFGGLASLGEESKTPGQAFQVAIAGPLVSFFFFGLFNAIIYFTPISGAIAYILGTLAYINLALGLFNLIPGLPLDGGNVLKSIVWKITGKPYKGVAFASAVGQVFGWLGIGVGLASVLGFTNIGSFWTILIGLFLLQNAGRSAQTATIQEQLSGLTAADAVYPDSPIIAADSSLREFVNNHIIGSDRQWQKFLVTNEEGQLVGEIRVEDLKTIPTNDWWDIQVRSLTHPIEQLSTVPSDQPLLDVINLLDDQTTPVLAVLKENNVLVGLVEKASILQLLQKRAEVEQAA